MEFDFSEMFDRIPSAVFLIEVATNRVWYSNKAAKRMFGVAIEENAAARGPLKVLTPKGEVVSQDNFPSSRALRGERLEGEEMRIITAVGDHYVKVFSDFLPAAGQRPSSIVIFLEDLSAQKKVEDDLAAAIDVAQVGFWKLLLPSYQVQLSPLLIEQFGIRDTFDGTLSSAIDAIHPSDRRLVESAIDRAVRENSSYEVEYRVVKPSGEIRWIEARGRPYNGFDGKAHTLAGTTLDVTDRKHADQRLQRYADAMPQMAFIADRTGAIIYFNRRFFEFTGLRKSAGEEWRNQNIHHPDDLLPTIKIWEHSLRTGEPYEIEYRLRRYDGVYRWHLGRAVPERGPDGEIEMWFGTNTDIHDTKIKSLS